VSRLRGHEVDRSDRKLRVFLTGLLRSEIVGLDRHERDRMGGAGWIAEIVPAGMLPVPRGKAGWREVRIARCEGLCPVGTLTGPAGSCR
jgi:hypothetical protein